MDGEYLVSVLMNGVVGAVLQQLPKHAISIIGYFRFRCAKQYRERMRAIDLDIYVSRSRAINTKVIATELLTCYRFRTL